jgi:hypothetical protein
MAVQQTGVPIQRNVNGSYRQNLYKLNITGNPSDTYDTKLKVIFSANTANTSLITNMTFSAGVITFTTTGTANGVPVDVIGR